MIRLACVRMIRPKISVAVKSGLARSVYSLGWIAWRIRKSRQQSLVLMYHRVLRRTEIDGTIERGMYIEPGAFEIHLKFLKKHFHVLPLAALPTRLDSTGPHPLPSCFLTFDDGWRDFYVHAFPLLKAYEVPATVFLPTNYIGSEDWFWTDRLAYLCSRRTSVTMKHRLRLSKNALIKQLESLRGSREARLEQAIALLKKHQTAEIENVLRELAARWKVDVQPSGRLFLTWDEVREMGRSSLVSYGSHGATHRILTTLPEHEVREELKRSKRRLLSEGAADAAFVPFCYPNGNYDAKILDLIRQAGYDLAVTTETGWVTSQSDRFRLKRVGVHQDISSTEALLGFRIAGAA